MAMVRAWGCARLKRDSPCRRLSRCATAVTVEEFTRSADRYDDHAGHEYTLFLIHFGRRGIHWSFRAVWDTLEGYDDVADSVGRRKHSDPGFFFFATQVLINRYMAVSSFPLGSLHIEHSL